MEKKLRDVRKEMETSKTMAKELERSQQDEEHTRYSGLLTVWNKREAESKELEDGTRERTGLKKFVRRRQRA